MQMLSEDDVNLRSMSEEELDAAWDLWFDLAQETNAFDPAYTHGVLVGWTSEARGAPTTDGAEEPAGPRGFRVSPDSDGARGADLLNKLS